MSDDRCAFVECNERGDYPLETHDGRINLYCAEHITAATIGC